MKIDRNPAIDLSGIKAREIDEDSKPEIINLIHQIKYKIFTSNKSITEAFELARTWMNLYNIKAEIMESEIKIKAISYSDPGKQDSTEVTNTVTVHYYETI